jgi:hypothetical protein
MKNAIFWVAMPYGSCKNRRFGGTERLHHQGDKNRRTENNVSLSSNRRTLRKNTKCVRRSLVPSSPSLVTLMMEALGSSETSVFTRVTRRNHPEDDILPLICSITFDFTQNFNGTKFHENLLSWKSFALGHNPPRFNPHFGRIYCFHLQD